MTTPFAPQPRFVWPDQKRCAAMICFDVDGETTVLSEGAELAARMTTLSQTRYGPVVGVPRLLGLLKHCGIPATFFIPTYIVENYPKTCRAIRDAGHEIGAHGHLHEKLITLDPVQERAVLEKSLKIMNTVLDLRPTGYRAPWFELNPGSIDLIAEYGFSYSASLMDDDAPYRHPNGVVEIPGQWMLEDWEQFAFNAEPAWGSIPQDVDKVYTLWWREFEAMRDYGCCFTLTLHPWLSGRPSRVQLLERLFTAMLETGDVWFATGSELASYVIEHPEARHEINLEK
jgi:peptidoglycan/xylan/chitin deacetylase (PgdA/CDA1 family)